MHSRENGLKRTFFKCLAVALAVMVSITMAPISKGTAYGATKAVSSLETQSPEILVTGTSVIGGNSYSADNVSKEKAYTRDELKALKGGTNVAYSAKNSYGSKKLYKASGVYVSSLFEGTDFDASKDKATFLSGDNYTAVFDPNAEYVNNGTGNTTGLNETRYYFPKLNEDSDEGKTEVNTMLAWALSESTESAGSEKDYCTVVAGQISLEDMNNPLYNKQMQRVIGGEKLTETALTFNGKKYTRGDVLLEDRADRTFTYESKGGESTDYVRGVPLAVLLEGCSGNSTVNFETADGFDVTANGKTVDELIEKNYILAYEKGSSKSDLKGIYETAKNDSSKYGYFTLYGDGEKPAKLVNAITVTEASGIDFSTSPYKHITNGGLSGQDGPYDIDGITGATLTIEGPGVKNSVPLSVRDLEGENNGAFRGNYTDTRDNGETERTYEGIDLYHILHNMSKGSNGIILTDTAKKVLIKNRTRNTIATFTIDQINAAHEAGKPILVSYGTSYTDGTEARPFVFDNGAGGKADLGNEDGCLKLVYDKSKNSGDLNNDYIKFANMAYIYVAEDSSPGYKHDAEPYNTAENSQYVLTVTGEEIGREVNYTVEQLENMVSYDSEGKPVKDGVGHRDEYSLANSSYWYVNEYEGVKLWDLLLKSGLSKDKSNDDKTVVSFSATDGYTAFDKFTLKQVADPDSFGYYEKNAEDNNDGKYEGVDADLLRTGFPVLVAYGVNGYPYVIKNTLDGYMSGLQNDGGPLRIISGKMNYRHANGSNQAKLLDKILVGKDTYHYSTHKYHSKEVYKKQADDTLQVKVLNGSDKDAAELKNVTYTVGDIEDLVYGDSVSNAQLKDAKIKGFYENIKNSNAYSDLYEGVNLGYFLKKIVEIPGEKGTITFGTSGGDSVTMNLSELLKMNDGYNSTTKLDGLSPVLAFAKNGAPMVAGKTEAEGYEDKVSIGGVETTIKNNGGPLSVMIPNSSHTDKDAKGISNVTSITINLTADKYAHIKSPYDAYGKNTLTVSGEGLRITEPKEMTLTELEGKQTLAETGVYSILKDGATQAQQQRYRGINLYQLLKSIGLKNNADKVIVTCEDQTKMEFSLSEVRKSDYLNSVTGEKNLSMILAYGSASADKDDVEDGLPLVKDKTSEGYDAGYGNNGGPVKLVVGQTDASTSNSKQILKNVVSVEVTAAEVTSWNHSSNEIFKQYLDYELSLQVINDKGDTLFDKKYTVEQLEAMTDFIEREQITATSTNEWEGVNLWNFVNRETQGVSGMDKMINFNVYAEDGFSKDILSIFGKDQLQNGIKDGSQRIPIILGYAVDGYPLASGGKGETPGEGYDSQIQNNGGPIRLMTHGNQGACLQETNKIVIKVSSSGATAQTDKFETAAAGTDLPDVGVRSVQKDSDGGLWIGTYGGGLVYKAPGSEKYVVYNKESDPALATGMVSAVAVDADGGVWLSQNASYTEPTKNKGVLYFKDGKLTSYTVEGNPGTIPDNYVQDIKIDDEGCVWFASFGGLTKYDPKSKIWKTWDDSDGFPAKAVTKLEFDGKGGVWCGFYPDGKGTSDDVFKGGFAYLSKDSKITSYPVTAGVDAASGQSKLADVWVRDIAVDKNGEAWIVASGAYANIENTGGTLWHVSSPGEEASKYTGDDLFGKDLDGASNAEIRMVEADANGGLWFGTSADGIFYVEKPTIDENGAMKISTMYSMETGSWSNKLMNNVYSLDIIDGTIYAGSSGGLAWLETDQLKPAVGDSTKDENDLAIVGSGVINNGYFTIKGLKNADGINKQTLSFKWMNSSGTTGVSEIEGATVENILKDVVGLEDNAAKVTFIAEDGYSKTFDISEISVADMDGNKPMIAWKEDGAKVNLKLVIGQKSADDKNRSKWVSDIVKIVVEVGDAKPDPDNPDKPEPDQPNPDNPDPDKPDKPDPDNPDKPAPDKPDPNNPDKPNPSDNHGGNGGQDNQNPVDDSGNNNQGTQNGSDKTTDKSAKTGDEMPMGAMAVIMLIAVAGSIGAVRFRKKTDR